MSIRSWFRKLIGNYRLRHDRCPYCNEPLVPVRVSHAGWNRGGLFCPERHSGFLYQYNLEDETVTVSQLDNDGDAIPIDPSWITFTPGASLRPTNT